MARVQLQTLDAGIGVALVQLLDEASRVRRVGMVPALLVRAALATPDAVVRGLHAGDTVCEEFAELLVGRHAARRHLIQASHVNAVVVVVLLINEEMRRQLRDRHTPIVPLVPHAFHAYPGVQALVLIHKRLAASRCIPTQRPSPFTILQDSRDPLSRSTQLPIALYDLQL